MDEWGQDRLGARTRGQEFLPVRLFLDLLGRFQVKPVEIGVLFRQPAHDHLCDRPNKCCQVPHQLVDWAEEEVR